MTIQEQKDLINTFITEVWNQGNTTRLDHFLHPHFTDHSLPAQLPANATGLQQWVAMTHTSFKPETIIEEHLAEEGKNIIKIVMRMKHTGLWRGITATGLTVTTKGYRSFRFQDGRIIEHWALIDGNALEQGLKGIAHDCKIAE
ncbi:SnoaL-like polyketide cyclase [Chitinophaga niastensis]|uniref:SnoaL-like polyketide cyclase n=1 Tax=Chitinophaga niastensis TaxID=536980 RepID=A0A2P8HU64_CHINA|nr:ester cyclase [Chitinophaga niastensis]PSL49753.1 SnoaL-like polyketide cyclase [Chitinophaga niastensis]